MRGKRRESRLGVLQGIFGGSAELLPVQSAESRAQDADARFRAMLDHAQAAEHDRATRAVLEREWREFERRNPGIEHPARTADRAARQAAEDADRAPRFTTPSPGDLGQATRRSATIRTAGPIEWDDNDPDLMEPPTMIDSPFRSGR